jgi:hypothetical protein
VASGDRGGGVAEVAAGAADETGAAEAVGTTSSGMVSATAPSATSRSEPGNGVDMATPKAMVRETCISAVIGDIRSGADLPVQTPPGPPG